MRPPVEHMVGALEVADDVTLRVEKVSAVVMADDKLAELELVHAENDGSELFNSQSSSR